MRTTYPFRASTAWNPFRLIVRLSLVSLLGLAGCDGLLDVDNPNNVLQDDLEDPTAATALANGAQAEVAEGVGFAVRAEATLSDELKWIGSWDAAQVLELGTVTDPINNFANTAFNEMSEARWMADEAIRLLSEFDAQGELENRDDLARSYLYGAIAYITIADLFDDFVISDRTEAAPPVGESNMASLYDQAADYLTDALAIARSTENAQLEVALLATRARAQYSKALWQKLNPAGSVPAEPLVFDAGASADAAAALALLGGNPDWRYQFHYDVSTVTNWLASWSNSRLEFRIGERYVAPREGAEKEPGATVLLDPVSGTPAPAVTAIVTEFDEGGEYSPFTVVSARELYLILAEGAFAQGDTGQGVAYINQLRALDGLAAYDPGVHNVSPTELIAHSRMANLLLQGRRLADQYRFNDPAAEWLSNAEARVTPGLFFPITQDERQSNCHLLGTC